MTVEDILVDDFVCKFGLNNSNNSIRENNQNLNNLGNRNKN